MEGTSCAQAWLLAAKGGLSTCPSLLTCNLCMYYCVQDVVNNVLDFCQLKRAEPEIVTPRHFMLGNKGSAIRPPQYRQAGDG